MFNSDTDSDLECAKHIWIDSTVGKNRYRASFMFQSLLYLTNQLPIVPNLLTNWWLLSHFANEGFLLPECLVRFTEPPYQFNWTALSVELSEAADCLWSCYAPVLKLMLQLHWARPNERNALQHPVPTVAFAQHHLKTLVSEREMQVLSQIIEAGTRMENGQRRSLFKHEDEREVTNKNHDLVLCEVLLDLVDSIKNESVEEKKRENQSSEDDDRAAKRPKHSTPP